MTINKGQGMQLEYIEDELLDDKKTIVTVFKLNGEEFAAWCIRDTATIVYDCNGSAVTDSQKLIKLHLALDSLGVLNVNW